MTGQTYTGGCQCGAVRFRVEGALPDSSICHCRMCQKAFGSYFAPLVSTRGADLTWTRGRPKSYKSSNFVLRGFCGDCGTPLTYEAPDGVAIAAGAFDDPSQLPPIVQFGTEGKLPFFDDLHRLPGHRTEDDADAAPFVLEIVSYQHPDHDTATWPPEKAHE
ncbi:GFA family protein [Rhizobiaceae bacterium n13]|uniref:GFA family protein n=1 Tax=Ferirhizobium litorale TaxID=2927786 RepID=A0AAE3U2D5_9HYPH|nr:GFA family protein [Fererhizobium litorale]MDI7861106.1 GFA family protein [Fererhizobium litorale]MDI7921253.1 GFA family protein [Fererhizobium litorale]